MQWSTDNSSWTSLQDGASIASGGSATYSLPSAQADGTTVYFQVRSGWSNPSSNSYTASGNVTIDCSQPVSLTVTQSLGTCSAAGGTRTSTLSIANSSGSTAYVTVQYKIDSGSWQDHGSAEEADNLTVISGTTNPLYQ